MFTLLYLTLYNLLKLSRYDNITNGMKYFFYIFDFTVLFGLIGLISKYLK
jgi:hypothetical protein